MTATLTINYDPDDPAESARVAAFVRGDDHEMRAAAWELRERLHQVMRGKVSEPSVDSEAAEVVLGWLNDAFDGLPLSLE